MGISSELDAARSGPSPSHDIDYECMWLDVGTGEVIIGVKKGDGVAAATADDMAAQLRLLQQSMAIGQSWGEDRADLQDPLDDFVRRWDRSYGG